MKGIVDSASELIGKTPMLYLHNYMKEAGVEDAAIIAKLEYFNPAGSVKDRVALAMIEDAERKNKGRELRLSSQLPVIRESDLLLWRLQKGIMQF